MYVVLPIRSATKNISYRCIYSSINKTSYYKYIGAAQLAYNKQIFIFSESNCFFTTQ